MKDRRPQVLIERWLPVAELGVECQRERGASSALPPLYFLHVWWARRPLTVSRAAVLGSLLPAWTEDWPAHLRARFPTEAVYREWFVRLMGILGDPLAGRRLIEYAKERGIRLKGNPYGYPRAFTVNPAEDDLRLLIELLDHTWGTRNIAVMDPMAGGGSIPFEALRFGFTTYANELNPVAVVILKATLDYPARFGPSLGDDIRRYGRIMADRVEKRLAEFYPLQDGERIFAYIWARTVACPSTGKPVPLSPNWWLQKGSEPVAVRLVCDEDASGCRFEIVRGRAVTRANPDRGTVSRAVGRSPWTGEAIPEDYIKAEAQAGRMGQQLYALGIKNSDGKEFRLPTPRDLEGVAAAEEALRTLLPRWEREGLVPTEDIPEGLKTAEPLRYGMRRWSDVFSPRQLLALGTHVEVFREVAEEVRRELSTDRAEAVLTYLALAVDKGCDRNSYMARWITQRGIIANTFDRHDFSFKWSYAEFDAAHNLAPWTLDQVADAYVGIVRLLEPARSPLFSTDADPVAERLQTTASSAASLAGIAASSVHLVCVDPPYYDNVMYGELSDFFYVWMKRTVGDAHPGLFALPLVDKEEEAVANVARFAGVAGKTVAGRKRRELAEQDYQRKMAACFREIYRILHPEGVLTVMFTHKRVDAWDTLATALIGAGLTVETSWPVRTESEHSLHQAKKNAAQSTILLVCRKRERSGAPVWWDDLKGRVRQVARDKAVEFERQGISGVDLYLSTFGPALAVISERWPVLTSEVDEKTGQPRPLRPEVALDLARAEVIALRKQGLLLGRTVQFDPVTDWYLMAWDAFKAEQFPADEARKLAIVLGLDLEQDLVRRKKVLTKKQNFVAFQPPNARRTRGMVDPDLTTFDAWVDAVHTALLVYQEDGARACEQFLRRAGLLSDATFKAFLQALINAVPRTKEKGQFVRVEADLLDRLRLAFFEDLQVPPEPPPPSPPPKQTRLGFGAADEDEEADGEEAGDEQPVEEDA